MFAVTRVLLLAAALISSPKALVLTSGDRIGIDGEVTLSAGAYIFRSGGTLYSLPEKEVDIDATNRLELARRAALESDRASGRVKMRATAEERGKIFEKLNNTAAATSESASKPEPAPAPMIAPPPPAPEPLSRAELREEERYWREESRRHHDAVEHWREEIAFLASKEQELEDEILMLLSLGYESRQFSREVLQLERTREAQERARLELARAERALQRFLTDARREGILPGWLR